LASHNIDSIELAGKNYKPELHKDSLIIAQLLGIAQNATIVGKKYVKKILKI
jgi:hypothetical protein